MFWTTPAFTSRRARKNWWPTRAVNCSSGPLTRPISTRSNTSGPGSKRPCAASCPSPKTRPGQFPICVNVMLVSYSNHDEPIAPNRLASAPKATAPNQIWVGDITYIETQEGWLYLAGILDLYSRKLVGWAMSEHIDTTLVLKALAMACWHRRPPANLLFHSDRGVQSASGAYRQALRAAGLGASMSRKGNCYDNATMESFWSTLKLDLVYRRNFVSHEQARAEIFDYIEVFYNRQRTHSALGFFSPVDFELINN